MSVSSSAEVATPHAGKYMRQLCSHWTHNLAVTQEGETATVTFPRDARGADWPGDAVLTMQAHPDRLSCALVASHPDQLEALKGAVARHIDRFAFREGALVYDWRG